MSKVPDSFSKTHDTSRAVLKRVRTRKEDSAFVYAILEASEGICAYTTLDHVQGSNYRDLELQIPPSFVDEVNQVLESLSDCLLPLDQLNTID